MSKTFLKNNLLNLLILIIPSLIIYFPSLTYGFSQDDFIHLSASQINNFSGFLNFFNPFAHFPDIFFYRPLSTQVYFYINQTLFGLNPLPFHLEGLFFHCLNIILFYYLVLKLFKNKNLALLSGALYGISAIHFLSLFYISSFQEILKVSFLLSSLLFLFKFQETSRKKYLLLSLISFMGALLSKETSLIFPLLILSLQIIYQKYNQLKTILIRYIKLIIPFLLISLIYILVRFIGFQSIFHEGDYQLITNFSELIQNIKWYLLWILGLPEILSTIPSLKPQSLIQFSSDLPYGFLVLGLFFLNCILIILGFLLKPKISKKILLVSTFFILISLSPILILHRHLYPQYLDISFVFIIPGLSYLILFLNSKFKYLGYILIISFILLQFFSLKLTEKTHWTVQRSLAADFYHNDLTKKVINFDEPIEVDFIGPQNQTKELSVALANYYSLKLWFPNHIFVVKYLNTQVSSDSQTLVNEFITKY